jgi:hypothetical protein
MENEVALFVDLSLTDAFESYLDFARIGARSQRKVVFEPSLLAVKNEIHAFVDACIIDPAEAGNIGDPGFWVTRGQEAVLLKQHLATGNRRIRIDAPQFHRD